MLAIYNGKEYVCKNNARMRPDGTWTRCWLELRSHTKDDEEFSCIKEGRYTKMVYGTECTDIRDLTVYAEYNNEVIQILYIRPEEICVCANSDSGYSEEFVEVVLGGQGGRDIYSWCKPKVFTGFHFVVQDFVEDGDPRYINERIVPVSVEEVKNYLILNDCEM